MPNEWAMTKQKRTPKFKPPLSRSQNRWWVRRPDDIGAQRLEEGGVPTSGAGSANQGLSKQGRVQPIKGSANKGRAQQKSQKELESDPHKFMGALLTPPQKPPSRGMRSSSSRCAPMSSARTPLVLVLNRCRLTSCWYAKRMGIDQVHAHTQIQSASISFAAPMVGASTRRHRSAATGGGRRAHQRGGLSKGGSEKKQKELESDPH